MPFDLHVPARPEKLPVTISLRSRKAGTICHLFVRIDALKPIGASEKTNFDVLIGSGDHAGKMRLRINKAGALHGAILREGLRFNLGIVSAFPDREVVRQHCAATTVGADVLEISLPDWSSIPDVADDDDDDIEPPQRRAPAPSPAPQPSVPREAPQQAQPTNGKVTKLAPVERNGITLDLTIDEESITFKNKTTDLTTRQAAVIATLLRAMPSFIGREWLCANVLTDIAKPMRDVSLDMIFKDLSKALPGIGLELKVTAGVGAALAVK